MKKQAKIKLKKQIKIVGLSFLMIVVLAVAFVMAAEGDYLSIEWNTMGTGNLRGIESNGTYIWGVDVNGATVNKYSARDGTYISNFSVAASPYGVTTNGTWIWVLHRLSDTVAMYNMSGTLNSSWALTGENSDSNDLTTNGSQFWVCDIGDDIVYTYNMSGFQTGNWSIAAQGNTDCVGIAHDGVGNIWTMDEVDEDMRRWNADDGTYISGYDTGVDTATSYGIAGNASWIYVSAITSQSFFIYEGAGIPAANMSDWGTNDTIRINSTNGPLTDYPVKVNVDLGSLYAIDALNKTCKDIRFTDINGQLIDFWIENCTTSSPAMNSTIWVEVPVIDPSLNSSIFMYYNNSDVDGVSSGVNTFTFFDSFESGDLTKWGSSENIVEVSTTNPRQGIAGESTYGVNLNGSSMPNYPKLFAPDFLTGNYSHNAWYYDELRNVYNEMFRFTMNTNGSTVGPYLGSCEKWSQLNYSFNWYGKDMAGAHLNITQRTAGWVKLEIRINETNSQMLINDSSYGMSALYNNSYTALIDETRLSIQGYQAGRTYWDDAYTRQITTPEPVLIVPMSGVSPDNSYPNINTCTSLTIAGGNYTLANNISASTGSACINIKNHSITVDCNGFTINGSGGDAGSYLIDVDSLEVEELNNIIIKNCNLIENTGGAIRFEESNNSMIENCNIYDNFFGVYIKEDSNNFKIYNSSIYNQTNTGGTWSGLRISYSNNSIIRDSYIGENADYDIVFATSFNNTLINVTIEPITDLVGSVPYEYTIKWYFQPQVNYTNGTAAVGVNITATNVLGDIIKSELTGTAGNTTRWELTERTKYWPTTTYHNNYIMNATLVNWNENVTSFNVTDNVYYSLFLIGDDSNPVVDITYPATTDITTEDYLIDINYTVSDTLLESCWYSNETGTLNVTLATCGSTNVTGLTWNEGRHNVTIWANDSTNNIGSDTVSFVIKRLNVTLSDPAHDTTITSASYNFTANYTTTYDSNFTNTTFFIWYSNTTLYNETTTAINGTINATTINIGGLETGTYNWNVLTCAETDAESFCYIYDTNFTLIVGVITGTDTFNEYVYETSEQYFISNLTVAAGSSLVSANLVYNNSFYAATNISFEGTNYTLTRVLDIPLTSGDFDEVVNEFFWSYIFVNEAGTQSYQNTSTNTQNVTYIVINECNATYPTSFAHALNFTMYDELSGDPINATANATTIKATFDYWMGGGSVKKEYAYQNLSSSVYGEFNFCMAPINYTLSADMNMEYTAVGYSTRKYYLTNAPIDNISNSISLNLLSDDDSVKFFIDVRKDSVAFADAKVTVSKFFTGEGEYSVTEIRETDVAGSFVSYLDLDQQYQFLVVKDGVSYGTVTKQAICTASPCEMTLNLETAATDMWQGYYDEYATSVSYTLGYNDTTKMVTYTFSDLTGLAQYFQLDVKKTAFTSDSGLVFEPDGTWCNKTLAAVTGTLNCNMTNYTKGNFEATGYISRSPNKVVDFIKFVISSIKDVLGPLGIFVAFIIIVLVGMIGVWNPAVGVAMVAFAVLMMKILEFVAFSFTTVTLIIIMAAILIARMKT